MYNGKFALIDWEKLDRIAFVWAHQYFDEGYFEVFFNRECESAYVEAPCAGPEEKWIELYEKFDPEKNYNIERSLWGIMLLRTLRDVLAEECGFPPLSMFATEFGIFFFDAPLPSYEFVSEDEDINHRP